MLKNKILLILSGFLLVITILSVSSYTAPTYSSVNFTLCDSYTAPTYSSINFTLGDSDACGTTTCAIQNGDEWYVPAGCVCYKESSATEMYLNLNDWSCYNE